MTAAAAAGRGVGAPPWSRRAIAGAAGAAVLLLAAYAVVPKALTAEVPTPAQGAAPDVIALVVAGIPAELSPATAIPVGGALSAYVSLERASDGPGTRDLELRLVDAQGRPVNGATIHVLGQMRYMDHGAFDVVLKPSGPGRYGGHLRFAMAGEHELRINVFGGGTTGSLLIDLDLR